MNSRNSPVTPNRLTPPLSLSLFLSPCLPVLPYWRKPPISFYFSSALQPPGLPGPPGAVLHTGEGENEAPPPAANGLTLHASNQSFSLGNPGENGNVWHTSFSDAPHSQGPHQHHQPLQHHIPGMSAAGDMCASSPVGGMSTEGDMCVSSPVGGQLNSSPTMECGLPANVGFEGSCCGIRLGEVQAGGVTGTAVGHDHRGGGGGVENGGVGPAQVPPTIPPGKNSVKKSKARGGKVSPDDGTPSPMGMHKLLEHKVRERGGMWFSGKTYSTFLCLLFLTFLPYLCLSAFSSVLCFISLLCLLSMLPFQVFSFPRFLRRLFSAFRQQCAAVFIKSR